MNYYEVLPLKKTGPESQTFTYEHEDKLAVGIIVQIPLKNRSVRGLVFEQVSKPKYRTRPITKILSEEPIISSAQTALARKISEYYLATLGETLNAFLPFDFGKKRHKTKESTTTKVKKEPNHNLTPEQKKAFSGIKSAPISSQHLLYGITGSGKTEVYLQLAEDGLKNKQGSIILVPEISLTPQTLARFEARFPGQVAVWHSHLKETEKYRTWQEVKDGKKRIVLGARSAIFLPVQNLGYIFIDEEHESSYKQDQAPRYSAIQVAKWLTQIVGCKLVLGSATPKIETFYSAQTGEHNLYSLVKRVHQKNLPPVEVIDLRDEFRKRNKSIFSDRLQEEIENTLNEKKQVVLFVNRRGASTFVVCRDCGLVERCPNCEIPLTYHPNEGNLLKCHHCEYKKQVPKTCPNCDSFAIKYFGLGTQRAEIEAKKLFPEAKVARMDRDTTKKRGSHEEIYANFAASNFDILIGTQLIAKGWDLPNVNLVGVIAADTTLNLPDFRAAEKTFSLLTQVAGRTGRGYHPGKVLIQTYNPDSYVIKHAKKHDYKSFYEEELAARKKYHYPPFSHFIKLVYKNKSEPLAERKARELSELLEKELQDSKVEIQGPSPAFIYRKNGQYHWQILVKAKTGKNSPENLINKTNSVIKKHLPPGWTVDVDPESLL